MREKRSKLDEMTGPRAYLDHNASAPILPEARAAMLAALELAGNPSSVHAEGRAARRLIEEARRRVAGLAKAEPDQVVFTSGATEAAATLLTPDWRMGRSPVRASRLYVTAADHPCLLGGGRFAADRVTRIGVNANGVIDLAALEAALAAHDREEGLPLVAVHLANNETGVIQPAVSIAALAKAAGGLSVFDAAQAAGRISLDIAALSADFLILSSHKMGGPKGVGAVVAATGLLRPAPLVTGGGQESGHRAGTENLAGIAGFGTAAETGGEALGTVAELGRKRDAIEAVIRRLVPDAEFFGRAAERLANTTFFAIPGTKAETAQIAFDLAGVALSAGSACSSGKVGPSHVLKAMGHADKAGLRVSIGHATSEADVAKFAAVLAEIVERHARRVRAA